VLDIFQKKTAPAFEVALRIGAAMAGGDAETNEVLAKYSSALGVAYQIRDDLDDLIGAEDGDDLTAMRPTLPLALAYERTKADPENRELITKVWRRTATSGELAQARSLMKELDVENRCRVLMESYKEEAVRSLASLQNASLKGLLRRVISKIFTIEVKGWCSEFETRNAADRKAVAEAAR
jgi:geranylgeranyl pyrophosphate synthase